MQGDIDCAIETTKNVLDFRRACLAKQPRWKKGSARGKQEVSSTLINLARLVLLKGRTKEAENYLKEALELYQSSGLQKGCDRIMEVQRELERLKWIQKKQGAKASE